MWKSTLDIPLKNQNTFYTLASDSCDSSLHMHPPLNPSPISALSLSLGLLLVCMGVYFPSPTHAKGPGAGEPGVWKGWSLKRNKMGIRNFSPQYYKDRVLTSTYCSILRFRHIMGKGLCHLHFFYLNVLRQPFKKENSKTLRNVPSLFWTACILQLI